MVVLSFCAGGRGEMMNMGEGRYELWFEKEVKEKLTVSFRNLVSNNFPLQQFSISKSLLPLSLTSGLFTFADSCHGIGHL